MKLIALPDCYGAAALGLAPGADPIRAARHEADALRPDVLVLDPAARVLIDACTPAGPDPTGWLDWTGPDVGAAFARLREVAAAVSGPIEVAVALPAPATLAAIVAERPEGPAPSEVDDWEELVDLAGFVVVDAASALRPWAVVLRERTSGLEAAASVAAWRPLAKLLRHEKRSLMLALDGEPDAAWGVALTDSDLDAVLVEPALAGAFDGLPVALVLRPGDDDTPSSNAVAVAVDAGSNPEATRELVGRLRS
jgi:hypothetical protein